MNIRIFDSSSDPENYKEFYYGIDFPEIDEVKLYINNSTTDGLFSDALSKATFRLDQLEESLHKIRNFLRGRECSSLYEFTCNLDTAFAIIDLFTKYAL
jgi:hypothetical protein